MVGPAVTAAQSLRNPEAKPRISRTGLASACAVQDGMLASSAAQHVRELTDQGAGLVDFLAPGRDLLRWHPTGNRCAARRPTARPGTGGSSRHSSREEGRVAGRQPDHARSPPVQDFLMFAARSLSWADVAARLAPARCYWLATVGDGGARRVASTAPSCSSGTRVASPAISTSGRVARCAGTFRAERAARDIRRSGRG